jgi:hypothetical protein
MKNHYIFTQPPQALRKAKLDNIAIVPASLLPFKETWQKIANKMPKGSILLCHMGSTKQQQILKLVESLFKQNGHIVKMVAGEGMKLSQF